MVVDVDEGRFNHAIGLAVALTEQASRGERVGCCSPRSALVAECSPDFPAISLLTRVGDCREQGGLLCRRRLEALTSCWEERESCKTTTNGKGIGLPRLGTRTWRDGREFEGAGCKESEGDSSTNQRLPTGPTTTMLQSSALLLGAGSGGLARDSSCCSDSQVSLVHRRKLSSALPQVSHRLTSSLDLSLRSFGCSAKAERAPSHGETAFAAQRSTQYTARFCLSLVLP